MLAVVPTQYPGLLSLTRALDVLKDFIPLREGWPGCQITDLGRECLHGLAQLCLIWLSTPYPHRQRGIRRSISRVVGLLELWQIAGARAVEVLPLLGELFSLPGLNFRSDSKDVHFVFLSFFEIISKHVIEDAPPTFLL